MDLFVKEKDREAYIFETTKSRFQLKRLTDFRSQLQILSAIGPDDSTIKIKSDKACKKIWIEERQAQSYLEYIVHNTELVQSMLIYFGIKFANSLTTADKPEISINGAINAQYDKDIQLWFVSTGSSNDH
ncbi:hypothetical protein F511_08266 [Dorcoceras hygrometricum]|uniref:Uncharacterized protein n=1 Tax=Dorcoceras hygrometricum TaxID=472368 RepID=A0A2Z7AIA7_9LAMI|nr:hypothetical protein F511_08266 [Dorcoceras hygrometricum]